MNAQDIRQVRRFNRVVARRIGALDDSYLARGRPLGEARLLFEIGLGDGADLRDLRLCLGLNSGYLSRLLRSLERQGLVTLRESPTDRRGRLAFLSEAGKTEWTAYDVLSDQLAETILAPLDGTRRARLLSAMAEVESLLRAGAVDIAPDDPGSADARWCLGQYFSEIARRFDGGFDPAQGGGSEDAGLTPPAGCLLLARSDGIPVGCGALKRLAPDIGEIKRLWIAPDMRGHGLAGRLMDELESLARQWSLSVVRLDTNRALTEARALYLRRGYREIARYNDNPYAHHWFEKHLEA